MKGLLSLKKKIFLLFLFAFFVLPSFLVLSNSTSAFAGSYNGSGARYRVIYNNFAVTNDKPVGFSGIQSPISSPWVLGYEYVMALDAGTKATKVSGHVRLPITASSARASNDGLYLRPNCSASTVSVGVTSSGFYSYNSTNLNVSNCVEHYALVNPSGSSSSGYYLYSIEFDFSADIPPVSGAANFSVRFRGTSSSDLIIQPSGGSGQVYFYSRPPQHITGNRSPYEPYFSISVAANQSDLIAQETQNAVNQGVEAIKDGNQQQLDHWKEEEDAASSAIDNAFDESSVDTTNILSLAVSFWSVVSSASPSDCSVSLSFPGFTKIGDLDLDFCSLSYSWPPVLDYIVALLVILPASIFWFHYLIRLIMEAMR